MSTHGMRYVSRCGAVRKKILEVSMNAYKFPFRAYSVLISVHRGNSEDANKTNHEALSRCTEARYKRPLSLGCFAPGLRSEAHSVGPQGVCGSIPSRRSRAASGSEANSLGFARNAHSGRSTSPRPTGACGGGGQGGGAARAE